MDRALAHRRTSPSPRVLVVGGGVAALEATMAIRAAAGDRVELELMAPDRHFTYRPSSVLAPFGAPPPQRFALERLAADHGASLRRDALDGVDLDARVVHAQSGDVVPFDELVVGVGGRLAVAVPDALTFRGGQDTVAMRQLIEDLTAGRSCSAAFVVPRAVSWPLPLYELALLAARACRKAGRHVELSLVTAEPAPLALFGSGPGQMAAELLEELGIGLRCGSSVLRAHDGRVWMDAGESVAAERVVSLPLVCGPRVAGLPHDADGFMPVDEHGRVRGTDVYAAGDATDLAIKQGGLAAQQADAIAGHLAWRLGAGREPAPWRPVLRGMLLTGGVPRYLRAAMLAPGAGEVAIEPLWWPPNKIVGRHLAPYLAGRLDVVLPDGAAPVSVEIPAAATAA